MIKFLEDLFLIILRIFPAEVSKNITFGFLKLIYKLKLIGAFASNNVEESQINIKNLSFKNRIGIAGGLDKDAKYFHIFSSLGFGFVEVGTITLEPQSGNPKPRIFRFTKDKTLVNSLGFNNAGSVQVLKNIGNRKFKELTSIVGAQDKWIHWVRLTDVNDDGSLDILVDDAKRNLTWINSGSGSFYEEKNSEKNSKKTEICNPFGCKTLDVPK